MTTLTALIGAAIRLRRIDLRMEQAQLARRSGTSAGSTNSIELRPRTNITIDLVERYASALGCRVSDIVRDAEQLRFMVAPIATKRMKRSADAPSLPYGRAIRELRRGLGEKLESIAAKAGLTAPQLCEIERSDTKSMRAIERCALGLGVRVSDIVIAAEKLAADVRRSAA